MGWGYGMGWIGAILMFLFWIAVIAVLVFLISRFTGERKNRGDEALDILRKRFASGEISKEEFEEKKKILGK